MPAALPVSAPQPTGMNSLGLSGAGLRPAMLLVVWFQSKEVPRFVAYWSMPWFVAPLRTVLHQV